MTSPAPRQHHVPARPEEPAHYRNQYHGRAKALGGTGNQHGIADAGIAGPDAGNGQSIRKRAREIDAMTALHPAQSAHEPRAWYAGCAGAPGTHTPEGSLRKRAGAALFFSALTTLCADVCEANGVCPSSGPLQGAPVCRPGVPDRHLLMYTSRVIF